LDEREKAAIKRLCIDRNKVLCDINREKRELKLRRRRLEAKAYNIGFKDGSLSMIHGRVVGPEDEVMRS
jgi:hypothetical protein